MLTSPTRSPLPPGRSFTRRVEPDLKVNRDPLIGDQAPAKGASKQGQRFRKTAESNFTTDPAKPIDMAN
jgi:hypothetical protein